MKKGKFLNRPLVKTSEILEGECIISRNTVKQLKAKGRGSFASRHEILGQIEEELFELKEAIHSGDLQRIEEELADIGTTCSFGIACIKANGLEW